MDSKKLYLILALAACAVVAIALLWPDAGVGLAAAGAGAFAVHRQKQLADAKKGHKRLVELEELEKEVRAAGVALNELEAKLEVAGLRRVPETEAERAEVIRRLGK